MVEISFYVLSGISISMLSILFGSYQKSRIVLSFVLILTTWIGYLFLLSSTGILYDFGFPPRIPLLLVIPAIIMIIFVVNHKYMIPALHNTPVFIPIALQSFRIFVELLIYATYLKGIFSKRATFEGLNFDILVGISAVIISGLIYKKIITSRGVLLWNIISLGILSVTIFSFISIYYFTDFTTSEKGFKLVEFPYILLPAVLLPIAIFLHAFSIKQILMKPNSI